MTIGIIKPGKLPPEDRFEVTCFKCGCVFQCERSDFRPLKTRRWFTTVDQKKDIVTCPCCFEQLEKWLHAKLIVIRRTKETDA